MFKLKIYNTITNQKETFNPVDSKHVRMYTCGPTVYNYAHIGNARPAIISDILVRVLRFLYPKVTYVSNITDIDDKIINSSQELGVPIEVLTEKYKRIYNEDIRKAPILISSPLANASPFCPEYLCRIKIAHKIMEINVTRCLNIRIITLLNSVISIISGTLNNQSRNEIYNISERRRKENNFLVPR